MIIIEDGSKKFLPYVKIEIEPAGWQFRWWFEVFYWDAKDECWVHHYEKDGGGWGLWNTWRKAQYVLVDVWYELTNQHDH